MPVPENRRTKAELSIGDAITFYHKIIKSMPCFGPIKDNERYRKLLREIEEFNSSK